MRSICNIDYNDSTCNGSYNTAIESNDLLLNIIPKKTQRNNYRIEIIDTSGNTHIENVQCCYDGTIDYEVPISYWNTEGTMEIQLLSDEGNSGYVTFNCISISEDQDVCCKWKTNSFHFHLCNVPKQAINVIDNLTSTSTEDALSANQGRVLNESKLGYVQDLGDTENLNDITKEGYYHQRLNVNASLSRNYPVETAGLLTVINRCYIYQIYQTFDTSGYWYRSCYNGTWYAWRRVTYLEETVTKDSGVTAHMTAKSGIAGFDEATGGYIRTPVNGLLPNVSGGSGYVGTSGWPFNYGYFKNGVYINGKNVLREGMVTDYIVENGTSGMWNYAKWNSGRAECWGKSAQTINHASMWSNGHYYGDGSTVSYPFTFAEIPICNVFKTTYNGLSLIANANAGTTTTAPKIRSIKPTSGSLTETFGYYVIGRWK